MFAYFVNGKTVYNARHLFIMAYGVLLDDCVNSANYTRQI